MNERLEQIRQYYKDAHAKGMPYWTYDDDTQAVGYLLEQLQAAQAAVEGLREEVRLTLSNMYLWDLPDDPHGYAYEYDAIIEQAAARMGIELAASGKWAPPAPQPQKGGEGVC